MKILQRVGQRLSPCFTPCVARNGVLYVFEKLHEYLVSE